MSLQLSSRILRSQCPSCRGRTILLPPSHLNVSTTTTTTMTFLAPSMKRHYAISSPAAKRKAREYGKAQPAGTFEERKQIYLDMAKKMDREAKLVFEEGQILGSIGQDVDYRTFTQIAQGLMKGAFSMPANAESVNEISRGNPDRAFDVGNGIYRWNPWASHFGHWLYKSTAAAGAVIPLALEILNDIKRSGGVPRQSFNTAKIIRIAQEKRNPLAKRVWAELLYLSGQKDDALALLQELVDTTYASNVPETPRFDITIQGQLKQPWERMSEIYESQGNKTKANEMLKLGALIYRHPTALVAYAYERKEQQDWDAYEQCLVVAATSLNGEACFHLANYYYHIHKGQIESPDERNTRKKPSTARFSIRKFRTKDDFRKLAMNWYELASSIRHTPAARNYAVLLREDGAYEEANAALDIIRKDDPKLWNSPNTMKLRESFFDPNFKPALPPSWIPL